MRTTNERLSLPPTRRSLTHKFMLAGHEGYLTIGLFEDGTPGEIFIKMSKEGSTLSGLIQGFCRAFSLALQFGLPVNEACDRFRGMRFDPMGMTNNPEIPEASSILDYVARYLELYHQRQVAGLDLAEESCDTGTRMVLAARQATGATMSASSMGGGAAAAG